MLLVNAALKDTQAMVAVEIKPVVAVSLEHSEVVLEVLASPRRGSDLMVTLARQELDSFPGSVAVVMLDVITVAKAEATTSSQVACQ